MSETRIRPITRAALQKAGYLYADTVQEAFGKYEGGILSAQTREDMREFLREVERQNQGAMYGDFYYPVLEKNTILRNYAQSGENIARFLLENGLRRPVYCGYPNESFRRFVEVLGKAGICFNPENLLAEPGEI